MKSTLYSVLLAVCLSAGNAFAQAQQVVLPGFTAYADPEEKNVEINYQDGVVNWTGNSNSVNFYFHATTTGTLKVVLQAKADAPGKVTVGINGTEKVVAIPNSADYTNIPVLQTKIKSPGFYTISLKGVEKAGKVYADIKGISLEGAATKDIQFNPKPWRRAASVHLN